MTRFINGSHLLRVRNLPGLHATLRLAASSLTVASDDVFRRDVVPEASHPTVTSRARPGRQLPVVRQVTARQTARDKTETDFAIHYIADLRPADGDTCRTGWLYLTVMLDLFSRQVVGWSMQPHMRTQLVSDALRMAWFRRRPEAGLIVHSDRGSQYCSHDFQDLLKGYGMRSSMSRKGNCWDNAPTESLWGSLKRARILGRRFATRREAMDEVIDWLSFYNHSRLHSTLGYVSPMQFEQDWYAAQNKRVA